MLLSTFPLQNLIPTTNSNDTFAPLSPPNYTRPQPLIPCRATTNTSAQRPLSVAATSSASLRHVSATCDGAGEEWDSMVSSAAAVAAAIRAASTSPVEFVQRIERGSSAKSKAFVLPSPDFQRLCVQQLDLFRRIVNPDAILSLYVRPAGSYVMDRLELRLITSHPSVYVSDIVVLIGNFSVPAGLRVAEAAISSRKAEFFPDLGAVVFPMVTHPFVVGFLVAELPKMSLEKELHDIKEGPCPEKSFALANSLDLEPLGVPPLKDEPVVMLKFTREQILNSINITKSLAMAYVMDQKAMLLQQSSWQNNVRISDLVEQIRSSLSSVRTLSQMLSVHMRRSEISYDIVEDILVQADRMRDTLQQLQDAVYMTKENIMRCNNNTLKNMHSSTGAQPESISTQLSNSLSTETSSRTSEESNRRLPISLPSKDLEFPMPALALAPSHHQEIRPCKVFNVLEDLVVAIKPLANKQQRFVELCDLSRSSQVAVDEPALRQALSNLIEGSLLRTEIGGKVEVVSTETPAGALIIIDDDGPDMHYMTQMHSLAPFGSDLLAGDKIEDNMTWNFVAGLTVAREILESYGCVVRVISPRNVETSLGTCGTRVEIWLPLLSPTSSDVEGVAQDAWEVNKPVRYKDSPPYL